MLPFAASAGLTLLLEDDKVAAGADPRPPAPGRRGPRHSTWLPPPGLGCVFAGGVVRGGWWIGAAELVVEGALR